MRILWFALSLFVIVLVALLALSIAVASLIHWLMSSVGLEMALLVAVIAVGQTMLIFGRLISGLLPINEVPEDVSTHPPIVILDQETVMPRRRKKRT